MANAREARGEAKGARDAWPLAALLVPMLLIGDVRAADASAGLDANDIPVSFSVRKTENRNRVDYGIRVDEACRAVGVAPVRPYWRMLEKGSGIVEPLRRMEQRAYGIASQRVDESGARIVLTLRALGDRSITIRLRPGVAGRCVSAVSVPIRGAACVLDDILVVQSGPVSVDHVELRGRALGDGALVRESITP